MDRFFTCLTEEYDRIHSILSNPISIMMTDNDIRNSEEAENCYLCNDPLGVAKERDHDHLTGTYRGATHSNCNLQFQF